MSAVGSGYKGGWPLYKASQLGLFSVLVRGYR
jgi:hypothetical protein